MRPDQIASAIRRAVLERVIRPGEVINQEELAKRFGVSRIPLREALRTLVGEGLIVIKPGLGAMVTQLDLEAIDELYGLRLRLEPPLAPDLVEHVRRSDVAELTRMSQRLIDHLEDASDEWSSTAYAMSRRLYELSERRHTTRLVVQVLNLVEPYARMYAQIPGAREASTDIAVRMVAALDAGDATRAERLIARGIETTRTELLAAMAASDRVLPSQDRPAARTTR